jgi:hypothetical protein
MGHQAIFDEINAELSRLHQARQLLTRGNGAGSAIAPRAEKSTTKPAKKHVLSAEARARIADAQKKRWAKTKRLAELSAIKARPKNAAEKVAKKQPTASKAPAKVAA